MCTTYVEQLTEAIHQKLGDNPSKKDLKAYKVYMRFKFSDGVGFVPPFGDRKCSVGIKDSGPANRWCYKKKAVIPYDGVIESERFTNDPLDEQELTFDPYLHYEGYISGIHTFVTPRAAIVYAWDNCGMLGADTVVVPVSIRREDFLCGGNGDFSVREYDYLEKGPVIIAFRIYVKEEDFKNPYTIFEYEKHTGKPSLLKALKKIS